MTLPQGSLVTGSVFAMFSMTGLSRDGEIVLFTNPRLGLSVICLPLLHWGEASEVKSPVSAAALGILAMFWLPSDRSDVR